MEAVFVRWPRWYERALAWLLSRVSPYYRRQLERGRIQLPASDSVMTITESTWSEDFWSGKPD